MTKINLDTEQIIKDWNLHDMQDKLKLLGIAIQQWELLDDENEYQDEHIGDENACICTQKIQHNFFVRNSLTCITAIIGST